MLCSRIENLLSAYLDGELDPDEVRVVESHLARCSGCRRELTLLGETKQVLASLARRSCPTDWERVLSTDVGVVARRAAHHLVSPRTVVALVLSVVGIWLASGQLDRAEKFPGASLPASAHVPVFGYQSVAAPSVADPSTCSLVVGEPASVRGPYSPAALVAAPAVSPGGSSSAFVTASYRR